MEKEIAWAAIGLIGGVLGAIWLLKDDVPMVPLEELEMAHGEIERLHAKIKRIKRDIRNGDTWKYGNE